jgi:hypothetical protein
MDIELTGVVIHDLKPGDVVMIRTRSWLSPSYVQGLLQTLNEWLPDGVNCAVVDNIAGIDVIRPDREDG